MKKHVRRFSTILAFLLFAAVSVSLSNANSAFAFGGLNVPTGEDDKSGDI